MTLRMEEARLLSSSNLSIIGNWELEEVDRLLLDIGKFVIVDETRDQARWLMTKDEFCFSYVKSMFKALHSSHHEPFPW